VAPLLSAAEPPTFLVGPYLQYSTQTSMAVMWETDVPCVAGIRYGKARFRRAEEKEDPDLAEILDQEASSKESCTIHEFTLKGLEPETIYFYQAHSLDADGQQIQSAVLSFQTAVLSTSPFAFVVLGDNRSYPERFKKLAEKAWAERPNFILNVGDLVSDGRNKDEWIKEYLAPAAELMKRVPSYVAIGNHEGNSDWFYKYSSYPDPENYYSFDYGNAHFTIVDSNGDLSRGSKQLKWIIADLAASKAKWKFVAHHHPPFSSDNNDYGNTDLWLSKRGDPHVQALIPIYEKFNVDVVWCGHIHTYERTWPIRGGKVDQANGVVYIQAGGGGAELEQFAPTRSWFTAKLRRDWQYCLVTLHEGTFRMMAYDLAGNMYDFLELKK